MDSARYRSSTGAVPPCGIKAVRMGTGSELCRAGALSFAPCYTCKQHGRPSPLLFPPSPAHLLACKCLPCGTSVCRHLHHRCMQLLHASAVQQCNSRHALPEAVDLAQALAAHGKNDRHSLLAAPDGGSWGEGRLERVTTGANLPSVTRALFKCDTLLACAKVYRVSISLQPHLWHVL